MSPSKVHHVLEPVLAEAVSLGIEQFVKVHQAEMSRIPGMWRPHVIKYLGLLVHIYVLTSSSKNRKSLPYDWHDLLDYRLISKINVVGLGGLGQTVTRYHQSKEFFEQVSKEGRKWLERCVPLEAAS